MEYEHEQIMCELRRRWYLKTGYISEFFFTLADGLVHFPPVRLAFCKSTVKDEMNPTHPMPPYPHPVLYECRGTLRGTEPSPAYHENAKRICQSPDEPEILEHMTYLRDRDVVLRGKNRLGVE